MAIEEIKQRWIISCDCCGAKRETTSRQTPMDWIDVNVGQSATDFQGNAVADASIHLALCRDCGIKVVAAMNAAADEIRAALRANATDASEGER